MKPEKLTYPSVHRGIVRAALYLLSLDGRPEAEEYTNTDAALLVEAAAYPDRKGDRMNGWGLHYYCPCKPNGKPWLPQHYPHNPNARGEADPSLLTMFLNEYFMAISQECGGQHAAAMESLSRAAHMLGDVCCPPHTCGMTYFTRYGKYHKRYEAQAARLFWGDAPVTDEPSAAERWAHLARGSVPYAEYEEAFLLKNIIRRIEDAEARGEEEQDDDPGALTTQLFQALADSGTEEREIVCKGSEEKREASIQRRLTLAIRNTAALFAVFLADTRADERRNLPAGVPLWIYPCSTEPVFDVPVCATFFADGMVGFADENGRQMAVSRFGRVHLTDHPGKQVTRFRLGESAGSPALFPNGDLFRPIGRSNVKRNQLWRYYRNLYDGVSGVVLGYATALLFSPEKLDFSADEEEA